MSDSYSAQTTVSTPVSLSLLPAANSLGFAKNKTAELASMLPSSTTQLSAKSDVTTRAVLLLTGSASLLKGSPASANNETQVRCLSSIMLAQ